MAINLFVRDASEQAKPSKKLACQLVKDLSANFDPDSAEYQKLAKLYTYFLPPVPSGLNQLKQSAFAWVAAATAGSDDPRAYLRYVYSDGNHMTATDGHRVHRVPANCESGYYCPSTGELIGGPERWTYADIDRVLAEPDTMAFIQDFTREAVDEHRRDKTLIVDVSYNTGEPNFTPSVHIKDRYLSQALAPMDARTDYMGITTRENRHTDTTESVALRIESEAFGGAMAFIMGVNK